MTTRFEPSRVGEPGIDPSIHSFCARDSFGSRFEEQDEAMAVVEAEKPVVESTQSVHSVGAS